MTTAQISQSTKDLVLIATAGITGRDLSIIDRHVAGHYKEHAQQASDGPDGLRAFIADLPADFDYERVRVLADDGLVVIHGIYHGYTELPLVAFDIWRVEEGKIVEHWDALAETREQSASGRTQTDGPHDINTGENTASAKALVTRFAEEVLVGGDYPRLSEFISEDSFAQHDPDVADGIAAYQDAVARHAEAGTPQVYARIHQVIAEGDFVFTRAEGTFDDAHVAFNDLWRVADGKIVEHWNIVEPIEEEHPHSNGAF